MQALWASFLAGAATGAGALPALFLDELPPTVDAFLTGMTAGVMALVAAHGLLVPALETRGPGAPLGLVLGAVGLFALDRLLHRMAAGALVGAGGSTERGPGARQSLLMWLAVALHNAPEGIAVGAAYAAPVPQQAAFLAAAIGLHNVPEGLAIALPLCRTGVTRWRTWAVATSAGLVEPLAAVGAYTLLLGSPAWLPASFALAAGAMLYVVFAEMIPSIERGPQRLWGGAGLATGALLASVAEAALHLNGPH
ncbi:MAG: ZIP family metal transporter [Bacillota bacterium]